MKQKILMTLTFGATLLAGSHSVLADEADTTSHPNTQQTVQTNNNGTTQTVQAQTNQNKNVEAIKNTTNKVSITTPVKVENITTVSQEENHNINTSTENPVNTVETPSNLATNNSQSMAQTKPTNNTQQTQPATGKTESAQSVAEKPVVDNTQQAKPVVDNTESSNQEIQDQIDKEQDHMNQDKDEIGKLEDENKDLQDKIDASDDQYHQEVGAIEDTAKEEIKDTQNKIDKIEQDQINSEKDKIQNDIDKTKSDLSNKKDQINDTESALQDKKDELDKAEQNDKLNSVIGSLVDGDKIDQNDKFAVRPIIPGTDSTENTPESDKQSQDGGEWWLENKGKETIQNHKLTMDQAWEINVYLMNRINATRRAQGQKEIIVTRDMFDKAMKRAQQESAANLQHNVNDLESIYGKNWAGENLGYAGDSQDLATMIKSALGTINIMFNNDGGEDHWGHRENFLRDYSKWGNVEGAFGFYWSAKQNRWVMVFDVMKYDGGSDCSNDLTNKYSSTGNSQIESIKKEITKLENQLKQLNKEKAELENKLSNLKSQKENVKFDYNKLDDGDKIMHSALKDKLNNVEQWKKDKIKEAGAANLERKEGLQNKLSSNELKIKDLQQEIKDHQNKIDELQSQLDKDDQEKPETPEMPDTTPETPETPEEKPSEPDVEAPSIDDNTPEQGTTDSDEDKEVPSQNTDTEYDDSNQLEHETEENNHNRPKYDDVENINPNSHTGLGIYTPVSNESHPTLGKNNHRYQWVKEVEAAEITPNEVENTRMNRLHQLPQTGSEENHTATAVGASLVALSSLLGMTALKRRKEN